ncbi:MAG: MFS transporter [Alphaproteobacteria bacterium]
MPRWYYGWNVIAVALIFQGITFGIGLYSFTFFIDSWMVEFDAGRGDILIAVTVSTLAIGVFGPFAGRAMDRLPIRALVCTGGALFALGLVALSLTTAVWQVIVIYALLMGGGLVLAGSISGQTLAAKWFRGRRGFAIGLVTTGTSFGGFFMPPLTTWLIAELGWRDACLALAAIAALAIIPLSWTIIRNSPEDKGVEPEPDSDHSRALSSHFAGQRWTTRRALTERAFWITVIAFLPVSIVFSSIQQNLSPLSGDLGITAQHASFLMSVIAGTMIVGKAAFGAAADRFDNRYLFWVEAALMALATGLLMTEPDYTMMLVICGLLGVAGGGSLPLLGSIVGNRFGPQAFGQIMGLLMPFLTISSFGAMATGWVRDSAGSYDPALEVFLIILIPAAIGMAMMPKLKRPAPSAGE